MKIVKYSHLKRKLKSTNSEINLIVNDIMALLFFLSDLVVKTTEIIATLIIKCKKHICKSNAVK